MWLLLSLGSAASWGTADFLGGLAARRTPALRVLLVGFPAGLLVALALVAVSDSAGSDAGRMLGYGAVSGLFGGLGIALLYAALAAGPMNVVAPVSAVTSAVVPVAAGLVEGERPGVLGYVGMLVAVGAVVLISREPGGQPDDGGGGGGGGGGGTGKAVLSGLAAGAMLGSSLVFLAVVAGEGSFLPLVGNRGAAWLAVLVVALATRVAGLPPRNALGLAVAAGVLDLAANAAYFQALEEGLLSVVGVIVALYPGGTVLLARVVLRERMSPTQVLGLALAAVGVVLLVLGD